jgi:hypothetical protein
MEVANLIMGLKKIVNKWIFGYEIRKNSSLRLLLLMLFYMDANFGNAISLESHGER